MKEISVFTLNEKIKMGQRPTIIDVREQDELDIVSIDEARHIPMAQIPSRMSELERDGELIIMCKSGGRSARVCEYLEQNGYSNVINLSGGILSWAQNIDRTLKTY